MTGRNQRRAYAAAVLGGVAAGAVMFFAASGTWASVEVAPPGMTADTVEVSGSSAVPLVGAMAFVVMAGSVAVVASGGWLRRAIGVVIVLAGCAAAFAVVTAGGAVDDSLHDEVASSTSMTGGAGQEDALGRKADTTPWRWAAFAGALVAIGIGGAVAARGGDWPRMGQRYEAPGARRERPETPAEDRDVGDLWKALDDGEDPTA